MWSRGNWFDKAILDIRKYPSDNKSFESNATRINKTILQYNLTLEQEVEVVTLINELKLECSDINFLLGNCVTGMRNNLVEGLTKILKANRGQIEFNVIISAMKIKNNNDIIKLLIADPRAGAVNEYCLSKINELFSLDLSQETKELVCTFLEKIDFTIDQINTLLETAIKTSQLDIVDLLLKKLKPNQTLDRSLIILAIKLDVVGKPQEKDNKAIIKLLVHHQNIEELNKKAYSEEFSKSRDFSLSKTIYPENALITAVYRGDVEIVKDLLEAKCDPNFVLTDPEKHEKTPLTAAILAKNENGEMINCLLDFGADPAALIEPYGDFLKNRRTAIVFAIEQEKLNNVKVILEHKLVNEEKLKVSEAKNQDSLLIWATRRKLNDAVQCLLLNDKVKETINDKNRSGETALSNAFFVGKNFDETKDADNIKTLVKMLLDAGASAEIQNDDGISPLMRALYSGKSLSIFEFLLDELKQKSNLDKFIQIINLQDKNGDTVLACLMLFDAENKKKMIEKILSYCGYEKSVLSIKNNNGCTALDCASKYSKDKQNVKNEDFIAAIELLERYTPENETLNKYIELKKASHILGLPSSPNDKKELNILDKNVDIRAEGFEDRYTFPLIIETLDKYISENNNIEFKAIRDAFSDTANSVNANESKEQDTSILYNNYRKGKMVVIPSGWTGHSITVVLHNDKLIISNRGDERRDDGAVAVFQLKQDAMKILNEGPEKFNSILNKMKKSFFSSDIKDFIESYDLPANIDILDLTSVIDADNKEKKFPQIVIEKKQVLYFDTKEGKLHGEYKEKTSANLYYYASIFDKISHEYKTLNPDDIKAAYSAFYQNKKHFVPIVSFPSKSQKNGTCSFVNKKSAIEAMLYLSYMSSDATQTEVVAKNRARINYKVFTKRMREQYIDKIFLELSKSENTEVNMLVLKKLLLKMHNETNKSKKDLMAILITKIEVLHQQLNENLTQNQNLKLQLTLLLDDYRWRNIFNKSTIDLKSKQKGVSSSNVPSEFVTKSSDLFFKPEVTQSQEIVDRELQVAEIKTRINELNDHAKTMPANKKAKVTKLVGDLNNVIQRYVAQGDMKTANTILSSLIQVGMKTMGEDRKAQDILAHVLLALTGVGFIIMLGNKMVSGSFFLNDTGRQKKLEKVNNEVKKHFNKSKTV